MFTKLTVQIDLHAELLGCTLSTILSINHNTLFQCIVHKITKIVMVHHDNDQSQSKLYHCHGQWQQNRPAHQSSATLVANSICQCLVQTLLYFLEFWLYLAGKLFFPMCWCFFLLKDKFMHFIAHMSSTEAISSRMCWYQKSRKKNSNHHVFYPISAQ